MFIPRLTDLLGSIIRREGRKFLKMESADDSGTEVDNAGSRDFAATLYAHIPFCRSLCPFCSFNRYRYEAETSTRYFKDLTRELDLYLQRGFNFSTVYIGGGTPTVSMDGLTGFLNYLRSQCDVRELSLETTPGELTPETIDRLNDVGINRLSIGVQSFDENLTKSMGRNNPPPDEIKRRLCLAAGRFDTVNIDFVFNFPGQSLDQFSDDVSAFKDLKIDQGTFYPLMPSPHKLSALERKFGSVDTQREARFFDIVLKELYHGDYIASTPWCYSRGPQMIDEYIIESDYYTGIGAGSVSMLPSGFYVNSFSLEHYHEKTFSGRIPHLGRRRLSEKERLRYHLLTGLFGLKLDLEALEKRVQADIRKRLLPELTVLKAAGIVGNSGTGSVYVTRKGMYAVSVMMREFFAALNTLREQCIEEQL